MLKPVYKLNPILKMGDSFIELACPKNISSMWSFGSLAGVCLVTQIVTGLFLSMYFCSNVLLSFDSAVYISRDVNFGWLVRNIHANGASIFFVCLYIHTGRGLYYGSYFYKETWMVGVTLLLLTIITAFLGYVLPWGQLSYWAATVITNLVSAVPYLGDSVVTWIWGGFSVSNSTLMRFYTFHYLFPFLIAGFSLIHLLFLHETGSGNPLGVMSSCDVLMFHPYFTIKDLVGVFFMWSFLGMLVLFAPTALIDPENFIPANPLVTPVHIQPEWYFLPMYAILRSIPNKLGGVVALIMSISILYFLPFFINLKVRSGGFNFSWKIVFWLLVGSFIVLMWIGSKPVEEPFEVVGQIFTVVYFGCYFLLYFLHEFWFSFIKF
nr:cytochrome b [Parantropora penelope]